MKIKGTNLMVDFETMDTKPGCIVLSCGYVLFNAEGITRKGYAEFDYWKQKNEGRTTSKSTVAFWLRENKEELRRLQKEGKVVLEHWIEEMIPKLKKYKPRTTWSRGSMDYLILQELFGEKIFPFWKFRDVRTLDEFGLKMESNDHNALGDCENQVDYVLEVFKKVT